MNSVKNTPIIFFVLLSLLLLSCSTQNGYKIKGESDNINFNTSNTTVFLYEIKEDKTLQNVDSTQMYSISKFTITQNSNEPITPKIGLLLVDNKKQNIYNIIYLEQGYIYASIKDQTINIRNSLLNDKKQALDKLYSEQNEKIQEKINQYLNVSQQTPIDSVSFLQAYNNIKILQSKLFDQIIDSIKINKDNILSQDNILINYYKLKNIRENGNNIFGEELFLEEAKKFKGYELDFAVEALSDSIKQNDQKVKTYLSMINE